MRHDLLLRGIKVVSVLLTVGLFVICWNEYYSKHTVAQFYWKGNYLVFLVYTVIFLSFSKVYDSLQISMTKVGEIVYSQVLAIGLSDFVIYIVICLLSKRLPWLVPGMLCFAAQSVCAALWSVLANKLYFLLFKAKRSMIVQDHRDGMDRLIEQYGLDTKFNIVRIVDVEECLENDTLFDDIEVVFFSGIHSHERNILLKKCMADNIRVFVIPRIGDVIMSGAKKMHMFHLPMLRVDRYSPSIEFLVVKRVMDVVVSFAAIILTSPIMIITAILIKAEDGGPVFYLQDRLTKNGRIFQVVKFRSMKTDAEKDGVARLSTGENDDRITRVGRVIRKVRIDELPQLFNVLMGEMSMIGPRPERPEIAADYEKIMPEFNLRLQAKAGLTGYAQVYGKYNTTPYDKLQMDLMYIANPSFIEEISIFFATIKILFMPESTEGIEVGATTAMGSGEKETSNTEVTSDK